MVKILYVLLFCLISYAYASYTPPAVTAKNFIQTPVNLVSHSPTNGTTSYTFPSCGADYFVATCGGVSGLGSERVQCVPISVSVCKCFTSGFTTGSSLAVLCVSRVATGSGI
jgi:hypothetical protein